MFCNPTGIHLRVPPCHQWLRPELGEAESEAVTLYTHRLPDAACRDLGKFVDLGAVQPDEHDVHMFDTPRSVSADSRLYAARTRSRPAALSLHFGRFGPPERLTPLHARQT